MLLADHFCRFIYLFFLLKHMFNKAILRSIKNFEDCQEGTAPLL